MTDNLHYENTVPVGFIEVIRDRLEKFTRRALKKNMPVPVLTLGATSKRVDHRYHDCPLPNDTCPVSDWQTVTITGDTPRIGPWSLVASIDNLEGKPFFRPVPGREVPVEFRNADPLACNYCNRRILTRTETFIVHNSDTDEFKQVGRQCIKDFLGWDISILLAYYERLNSIMDEPEGGWGSYIRPEFRPADVIRFAANIVSVDGRYVKAEYNHDSTKSKVWEFLSPPNMSNDAAREYHRRFVAKYTSQPELAENIYGATITALENDRSRLASSDWGYNVLTAYDAEFIGPRQVGVVASAVILGLRAIEDEMKARRDEIAGDKPSNEFIGEVGEKVSIPVTVLNIRYMDNGYGSYLVQMADEVGNSIKWFASNIDTSLEGKTAHITGRVKKHETYKGRNSTMLTRCTMEAF